jgi:hypothetical protein
MFSILELTLPLLEFDETSAFGNSRVKVEGCPLRQAL